MDHYYTVNPIKKKVIKYFLLHVKSHSLFKKVLMAIIRNANMLLYMLIND